MNTDYNDTITEEKKKEHIDKINKILDMLPCNECERMLHYMLVLFFSWADNTVKPFII